jgi:hypothetical protein
VAGIARGGVGTGGVARAAKELLPALEAWRADVSGASLGGAAGGASSAAGE